VCELEQTVLEILADVCGDDTLLTDPDRDLFQNDLLDSLAFVMLLTQLDDRLGVEIQPTRVPRESWRMPRRIIELVRAELAKK